MDSKFNKSVNNICGSMLLSSLASSLYLVVLPLYVYHLTNSAISTALQVTISAVGSLLACFFVNNFNIFKSDKLHIVAINVTLSILLCLPYFFNDSAMIYALYTISFVGTFLSTCSSGYIESLISFLAESTHSLNRQTIIGKTKVFAGMGSALGFFIGGAILSVLNHRVVFFIGGVLFVLSAIFMYLTPIDDIKQRSNSIKKAVYKILFSKNIFYLSTAHAISAVSLFIYNGTFIYVLKDIYKVDDIYVSFYFFSLMLATVFGSLLMVKVSRHKELPVRIAPHLRIFYALFFLVTAFSSGYWYFLISVFVLNFLHAFSIPFWQDCFQKYSPSSEWRVIGTSRKTLVAISGIIGSMLGGYLIGKYNIMLTYTVAALLSFVSGVLLMVFIRRSHEIKRSV
ncbi:MFS transporter [Moraxella sp. ZY200743]|uniref:MFS transporter n=1 Tax=Moraxella sp. ZY200743 TaxID=2911970 RepID=UPI003D7C6057